MGKMEQFLQSEAFSNAFWVFVGIVAGTVVQLFAQFLDRQRQAKAALQVLNAEINHNLKQVDAFMDSTRDQLEQLNADEVSPDQFIFWTETFDYSALGPLNNSGYLHILLGADLMSNLLRFTGFFNNDKSRSLHELLQKEYAKGNQTKYVQWVLSHSQNLANGLRIIQTKKKVFLRLRLTEKSFFGSAGLVYS